MPTRRPARSGHGFAAVCDYVPLRELPEFGAMFAQFTPLAS